MSYARGKIFWQLEEERVLKKILFVTTRLPFPKISGRKISLYYYCKILSQNLGYELIVASFLEKGDNVEEKPDFIDKLITLPNPTFKEKICNLVQKSFLKKTMPMQVSLYFSKKAKLKINEIIEQEKPDIVISDMVRTTEYLKDFEKYNIADLDDRLSLRYERQLEVDIEGINPYGVYLSSMPKLVQKFLLNKYVKRKVVVREIDLLKRYEIEMGKKFDGVIFVAQKEAEEFNKELNMDKAIAVPLGVDIEYFSQEIECSTDKNLIGFLGRMNVSHNEDAVRNFIENIFPNILKKVPNAQFVVIGGNVSQEMIDKYSCDNVIFTGRVEDIRYSLKKCRLLVCPLRFGSGIKTKNLEAMAMKVPVVTTPIGAENIHAINLKDWLVANNDEEFVDYVVDILNDDDLYNKLSENGYKFVKDNFTWAIAEKEFEKYLKKLGEKI